MKKYLSSSYLLVFAFLIISCFKEVDLGYPKTVTFSKDGGEKSVTGTTSFTNANIYDYKSGEDGYFVNREDDVESWEYEWLKIEYIPNSKELKIIAEPNMSAKSRKLHIELYSGPEYHVIKVKQY